MVKKVADIAVPVETAHSNEIAPIDQEKSDHLSAIRWRLTILCTIVVFAMLYAARDFFMPVVLGIMVALTLRPVMHWLEHRGIPSALAAFVLVPSLAVFIGLGIYVMSGPMTDMVASAPEIGRQLEAKFADFLPQMKAVQDASDTVEKLATGAESNSAQRVVVEQPGLIAAAASSLARGMTSIGIAVLFAMLLLSTGTLFYEKLIGILPLLSEKKRALKIVYDVEAQVSHYLLTITLINAGLGLAVGVALWICGFENALLWGAIVAVLNYLPFLGAFVGVGALAALSLATAPSISVGLLPPAIYFMLHLVEANIITPMILGRRLSLNVVAVFLTVILWGWIWGIAGALIAVPFLVILKVAADNIESLSSLSEFLGERRTAIGDDA